MSGSVSTWMMELTGGNRDAARKLWGIYGQRLLERAEETCRGIGADREAEDVVQSVFFRVVRRIKSRPDRRPANRYELWRLLDISLRNRIKDLKRIASRRRGEAVDIRMLGRVHDPALPPGIIDEFCEQIDWLARVLDPEIRDVMMLARQGMTTAEIASRLNVSRRTVQRKLAVIMDISREFRIRQRMPGPESSVLRQDR